METDSEKIYHFLQTGMIQENEAGIVYVHRKQPGEKEAQWILAFECDGCGEDDGWALTSELALCDKCREIFFESN